MGDGYFYGLHFADHGALLRRNGLASEITGHPIFQIFSLTDIDNFALGVQHLVNAGPLGQSF